MLSEWIKRPGNFCTKHLLIFAEVQVNASRVIIGARRVNLKHLPKFCK